MPPLIFSNSSTLLTNPLLGEKRKATPTMQPDIVASKMAAE
ncbi:hypothetical protein [Peribacillus sp. CSMR9]|nr:hypothetical protein [Peribacillus sp. CSMR9]MDV7765255.1 hypothetical protein [Peribacillus sp. CSMR9]